VLWFGAARTPDFTLQVDDNVPVHQGATRTFCFSIPDTSANRQLRVTIAWTDPAAYVGAKAMLVHDLHLVVIDSANQFYYGNGLKTTTETHVNHDVVDVVNNNEQVTHHLMEYVCVCVCVCMNMYIIYIYVYIYRMK
jgi:hypothetical protein